MKKLRYILLMIVLLLGLSLPGCGEKEQKAAEPAETAASQEVGETGSSEEDFPDDLEPLSEEELKEIKESGGELLDDGDEDVISIEETDKALQQKKKKNKTKTYTEEKASVEVEEDGEYTDKEHVAAYIHEFGHLPDNYITKNEARDLGWNSKWGNMDEVAPGKSIGGDKFGNYEGLLPEEDGRVYRECDIDFDGSYRNAKRIIYSNDGLIFYTDDHYESFTQLY